MEPDDAPGSTRPAGRARRLSGRGLLLIAVSVVGLASIAGPARAYWQQREQIAAQRADIAARSADVVRLNRQLTRWHDPAYVSAQARSRLGLVRPGEKGYVVVGPMTQPSAAAPTPSPQTPSATTTTPTPRTSTTRTRTTTTRTTSRATASPTRSGRQ